MHSGVHNKSRETIGAVARIPLQESKKCRQKEMFWLQYFGFIYSVFRLWYALYLGIMNSLNI